MAEPATHDPHSSSPVPLVAPQAGENPALIDAEKTFKIIAISALLFVSAAAFIILRTRLG
jgi:hypothetical protein